MKFTAKKIQPFLATFISLLFLFCPAYLQYNDLKEVDFLSSHPSFENFDLDNLVADENGKTKVHGSIFSPLISSSDFCLMGQTSHSYLTPSVAQPILALRC